MIIGAMKCGTTSLFDYLAGHPEICPSRIKEPEYFSEHQQHKAEIDSYEQLWDFDLETHKYALEASTGYTKYPQETDVPGRIFASGLRPKFIYIVRNPFERVESHFNFATRRRAPWHLTVESDQPINLCRYSLQLKQYRKFFSADDILVLDFDELRQDPKTLLLKIYRFLGISESWFPEEFAIKNPMRLESRFAQRLRKSKFGHLLGATPEWLQKSVWGTLAAFAPAPKKRILSREDREVVHRRLADEMHELNSEYGIDVAKWGF